MIQESYELLSWSYWFREVVSTVTSPFNFDQFKFSVSLQNALLKHLYNKQTIHKRYTIMIMYVH